MHYLTSGSRSNTREVSLSDVKLKRTFGAVLFLLLTFMWLSLLFSLVSIVVMLLSDPPSLPANIGKCWNE